MERRWEVRCPSLIVRTKQYLTEKVTPVLSLLLLGNGWQDFPIRTVNMSGFVGP